MYHYAGNNPIKYTDPDGRVVTITAMAAMDLLIIGTVAIFFYTQSDSYKQTVQSINNAIDTGIQNTCSKIQNICSNIANNYEARAALKAQAKELTAENKDNKAVGSYTITFGSGKTYSGKGPISRAVASAVRVGRAHDETSITAIDWTPAANKREAYKDEYVRIQKHGGPQGLDSNGCNYNMIQSPGEKYFEQDYGYTIKPTTN